uniref:Uncharacterized protein n=1 Tax=Conchiformibius kuhniae TaxID=211502 RepID=A0A8T9MW45_9NEIS|nr:hypothetical protein LVJ77_08755 [Conchiformibius kuhniae]
MSSKTVVIATRIGYTSVFCYRSTDRARHCRNVQIPSLLQGTAPRAAPIRQVCAPPEHKPVLPPQTAGFQTEKEF